MHSYGLLYPFFVWYIVARNECIISQSDDGVVTPCVNGYCVDSVRDYLCVCLDGTYQGKNCSEPGKHCDYTCKYTC